MAKPYFRVTTSTRSIFDTWVAQALNDDEIWPYLTMGKNYNFKIVENGDDDWDSVTYMDTTGQALLRWVNSLTSGYSYANLSVWSLPGSKQKTAAGNVLKAIPELINRYGVTWINAYVHASNVKSLSLIKSRLGEPWGVEPESAWNGLLGKFEDCVSFRTRTSEIKSRYKLL